MLASIAGLFALFPCIHLVLGILMIRGKFGGAQSEQPFEAMGWFFVAIASVAILSGLTFAGLLVAAGRCLQARRRHMFCLVMAGLSCCFMPFGTVLGVFTLLVLLRDGVKAKFAASEPRG